MRKLVHLKGFIMDIREVSIPQYQDKCSLYPLDSLPWQSRTYANVLACAQLLGLKVIPNPEDDDFEEIALTIAGALGVCSMLLISGAYLSMCHIATNKRYPNSEEKEKECILALISHIGPLGRVIWEQTEIGIHEVLPPEMTQAKCLFLGAP